MNTTNLNTLRNRLTARSWEKPYLGPVAVPFADDPAADVLLKDVKGHPHAYGIACMMDRQIKTERAWRIPYELQQRLGSCDPLFLLQLSLQELEHAMANPTPFRRYNTAMAKNLNTGIHHINGAYDGNAGAPIQVPFASCLKMIDSFIDNA